jgi:hypothetical protein
MYSLYLFPRYNPVTRWYMFTGLNLDLDSPVRVLLLLTFSTAHPCLVHLRYSRDDGPGIPRPPGRRASNLLNRDAVQPWFSIIRIVEWLSRGIGPRNLSLGSKSLVYMNYNQFTNTPVYRLFLILNKKAVREQTYQMLSTPPIVFM